MEESHFNSSYFWPAVPTVSGQQIDNSMFLNKVKEQLVQEKGCNLGSHYPTLLTQIDNSMFLNKVKEQLIQEKGCNLGSHYPTLLTVPTTMSLPAGISLDGENKVEIHGIPHSQASVTQNITVLPVPTTGLMTATGLVITSPSGSLVTTPSSSGQTFPISAPSTMIVSTLPGTQTFQVVSELTKAKISEMGNVGVQKSGRGRKKKRMPEPTLPELHDPYDLSNEDDEEHHKDGKTYRCRMCSITFFSKSEMQIHSKSHTEAKPHKCPHCSKTFANSSYLAQHVRIHSGAKPYTCNYCQKAFRQLSHLQQHTRIHTGDRPYKCVHPGCDKAFTQLSNLQSHRRQHNKDKPFKCHNCHRAYTDSSSLEVHLSTHTVKHAKVYTCSICSRAYTSETYLMKHMRKHNAPDNSQPPSTQVLSSQAHFTPVSQAPTSDGPQCSFDMNPFKTDHHKDLCLTVSTSAIQVEHLASS
ncbi:zinc finger protein 384 isoform X9 [Bufo gargarizans]|uniref:zinc finger protein 384 isoform X9 n=1 Tax=Bufo gargarizans TaxID=30331 RepID=UPI001CF51668|nr:zinc finger protein 384 isoform X9 [Bufo gargarizans]